MVLLAALIFTPKLVTLLNGKTTIFTFNHFQSEYLWHIIYYKEGKVNDLKWNLEGLHTRDLPGQI